MILAFLLALLAFLALLPILTPLMGGGRPVPEGSLFDQAVYRDQLQELERDIARGLTTDTEAETARIEIQRRLLAASRTELRPARLARSPILAALVLLVVGGGSVATYLSIGAPGLPDEPFASRPQDPQAEERTQMREAVDQLAERLRQNPDDGPGWLLFARSLSTLGNWSQAETAYQRAMRLGQDSPAVEADHAEMLVMQAGGTVTPAAEAAFTKVVAADHGNATARYYLAIGRMQAGEPKRAIAGLQDLLAMLPSNSPLRAQIGRRIAAAAQVAGVPVPDLAQGQAPEPAGATQPAPGPTDAAMAQAGTLPPAQQEAMIRGMVANLAAKQDADPGNFDGWMRLGRAYAVLKETDKAAVAYGKAQALRPDDISVPEAEVQALMVTYKPGETMPAQVVQLLKQIAAKDPHQPMALWYLGLDAVQGGRTTEARRSWQTLVNQLPAGSEDRRMVEAALATLPPGGGSGDALPKAPSGSPSSATDETAK